jgi:hypothetical protein
MSIYPHLFAPLHIRKEISVTLMNYTREISMKLGCNKFKEESKW